MTAAMTQLLPAPELLLAALTLGLLGTGHCLAMCGGIAGALGMRACATDGSGDATAALVLNAAGRLMTYALLGAVAGAIGAAATSVVPQLVLLLRGVAGLALLAMGAYLLGYRRPFASLERLAMPAFTTLSRAARGRGGLLEPLLVGAAWGLLPCGLVYGTLAWSLAAAGSAQGGALLMLCFGLGTLPAVLGATLLGAPFAGLLRRGALRSGAGVAVAVFGLWTIGSAAHAYGAHGAHPGPDPMPAHSSQSAGPIATTPAPVLHCSNRSPFTEPWEG